MPIESGHRRQIVPGVRLILKSLKLVINDGGRLTLSRQHAHEKESLLGGEKLTRRKLWSRD
jgi:hypothetical protein